MTLAILSYERKGQVPVKLEAPTRRYESDIPTLIFNSLRDSRHFKGLSDEALRKLLAIAEYSEFQKGEVLLRQGEHNLKVFVLLEGSVSVKVDDKYIYSLHRKGDVVGEMSIITDNPSSATVEAEEHLGIIAISTMLLRNIEADLYHELHHIFYRWFSLILSEKLYLTSHKAKLYEETQKSLEQRHDDLEVSHHEIAQKNIELEARIVELKAANDIINQAYDDLRNTKVELVETKKVAEMTNTFQKFVPEQFLQRMYQGMESIEVGKAETDFISVLFTDIRNFTTFSETLSPQEVFNFLNAYLTRMSVPIHGYGGFIDKFIGDAIMAIFNQPEPEGSDAEEAQSATMAALDMQATLIEYNEHRHRTGYAPISTGIGIHSGPVIMGTVGSDRRMDFTVIGDTVNLASRLESLSKFYGVSIVISQHTFALLKDTSMMKWRELDAVKVKGKQEPVVILEVFSEYSTPDYEQKCELLYPYSLGLVMFKMQDWDTAAASFEECLQIAPNDRVSQIYVQRCREFKDHPPGEDWNSIFTLNEK